MYLFCYLIDGVTQNSAKESYVNFGCNNLYNKASMAIAQATERRGDTGVREVPRTDQACLYETKFH